MNGRGGFPVDGRRGLAVAILGLVIALPLGGCQGEQKERAAGKDADGAAAARAGHRHVAPHGGVLVPLGEHVANLEFVLDPVTGGLTVYVLDGCAEQPIRLAQPAINLTLVLPPHGDELAGRAVVVALAAVASPLTGEVAGDTSQFAALVPELAGQDRFAVVIGELAIRGADFTGVEFLYPEGMVEVDGESAGHDHEHPDRGEGR